MASREINQVNQVVPICQGFRVPTTHVEAGPVKGYQRAHFDDAFSRYLRPEGI
jgi:hypothetical protein